MRLGLGLGIDRRRGAGTPAFDPLSLAWTGAWLPSFSGVFPHAGSASAGTSGDGSHDLASGGSDPTTTTALDGYTPLLFNGITNILVPEGALSNYHTAGAYTLAVLCKAPTPATDETADNTQINNETLFTGTNAMACTYGRSTGPTIGHTVYDGSLPYKKVEASYVAANWNVFMVRHTGTAIQIRVNNGSWQSTACGPIDAVEFAGAGNVVIARKYNGGQFWDITLMEMYLADTSISDANADSVYSYFKSKFPSAALP